MLGRDAAAWWRGGEDVGVEPGLGQSRVSAIEPLQCCCMMFVDFAVQWYMSLYSASAWGIDAWPGGASHVPQTRCDGRRQHHACCRLWRLHAYMCHSCTAVRCLASSNTLSECEAD